jgi:hypothetical protein
MRFTRGSQSGEDQLVDLVTALEAILGTEDELTFKLSFRIASLLAETEDQRVELFKTMKEYYAVRSRIVHGGELRQRHLDLVNSQRPLREIVRRLLVAVLEAYTETDSPFQRTYVRERLDEVLLHAERRDALRAKIGLVGGPSISATPPEEASGYIAAFDRSAGPPSAEVYVGGSREQAEFN